MRYLNASAIVKSNAIFKTALGIYAQYVFKEENKARHEVFYEPFNGLIDAKLVLQKIANDVMDPNQDAEQVNERIIEFIQTCLEGLRYLQTYDWLFLRSIISAGYAGWMVFCATWILRKLVSQSETNVIDSSSKRNPTSATLSSPSRFGWVDLVGVIIFVGMAVLLYVKDSPPMYYTYIAFPAFFWTNVIKSRKELVGLVSQVFGSTRSILLGVSYFIALEVLVRIFVAFSPAPINCISSNFRAGGKLLLQRDPHSGSNRPRTRLAIKYVSRHAV